MDGVKGSDGPNWRPRLMSQASPYATAERACSMRYSIPGRLGGSRPALEGRASIGCHEAVGFVWSGSPRSSAQKQVGIASNGITGPPPRHEARCLAIAFIGSLEAMCADGCALKRTNRPIRTFPKRGVKGFGVSHCDSISPSATSMRRSVLTLTLPRLFARDHTCSRMPAFSHTSPMVARASKARCSIAAMAIGALMRRTIQQNKCRASAKMLLTALARRIWWRGWKFTGGTNDRTSRNHRPLG